MEEKQWVAEINDELKRLPDASEESSHWRKRSIYRIPKGVAEINKRAYKPHTVSFGPYHHGSEYLQEMEEHKRRALLHFLRRSKEPLQSFVDGLVPVVDELRDAYEKLDPKWGDVDKFLKMMIVDGCFMLEILRSTTQAEPRPLTPPPPLQGDHPTRVKDYAGNDPIFSNHGKVYTIPHIKRDMLMLENQLPMELKEAGIRIMKSHTRSLIDISFHHEVLRLPLVVVDDALESLYLNLVAFERFHVGAGNEVTSYIFFMDNLINNAQDVSILHSRGIIHNSYGSDEAVANLFNSLTKDITLDPDNELHEVQKLLSAYCRKPSTKWITRLNRDYLNSPWAVLSILAFFFNVFTVIQTVYTVLAYVNR